MDASSLTTTRLSPRTVSAPACAGATASPPGAVLTNVDSIIDPRSVDWASVRRARFQVRHHYRYVYRQPISNLEQRLVMTPPDRHVDQVLLDHTFRVTGAAGGHNVRWEQDRFGNRVVRVSAPRIDEAVMFEATYTVQRDAGESVPPPDLAAYLEPTALTAPDVRIAAVAAEIRQQAGSSPASAGAGVPLQEQLAERAHDWASHAITYQTGVTGVQTPAAMALHLGRGVCQDYAHILLALLRLLRVPARYVSGHLLGEGVPHAWVEAFIGGAGASAVSGAPGGTRVIAYDPTHHRRAGLQYVTVATGRDFADVSPTSGSFTGVAPGVMTWGKHAALIEVS